MPSEFVNGKLHRRGKQVTKVIHVEGQVRKSDSALMRVRYTKTCHRNVLSACHGKLEIHHRMRITLGIFRPKDPRIAGQRLGLVTLNPEVARHFRGLLSLAGSRGSDR